MPIPLPKDVHDAVMKWLDAAEEKGRAEGQTEGFEIGHAEGRAEGFREGWAAAFKHISETAAVPPPVPAAPDQQMSRLRLEKGQKPQTTKEYAIAAVIAKPGMTTGEIIAWTRLHHFDGTDESIRTALKRLRRAGELVIRGQKNYLPQTEHSEAA